MGTDVDGDEDGDEQPGGYWLAREARRGIAIVIVTVMEEWPKGCGIEMTEAGPIGPDELTLVLCPGQGWTSECVM